MRRKIVDHAKQNRDSLADPSHGGLRGGACRARPEEWQAMNGSVKKDVRSGNQA
jgi:hypothetical protein